jgi:hypothetical protein
MPFVQVDDFLDQAEDAVALGYSVLERTIDEVKSGYKEAQDFNVKQKNYEKKFAEYERSGRQGVEPVPPEIPWQQVVDRAQNLRTVAFDLLRRGSNIMFDSMESGADSMMTAAQVWVDTQKDVRARPVAGPVFGPDPIVVVAWQGAIPEPIRKSIRHQGLARLRIRAIATDVIRLRTTNEIKAEIPAAKIDAIEEVSFRPEGDDDVSWLTVEFRKIDDDQTPGYYESRIHAANFELAIAKLVIEVKEKKPEPFIELKPQV